MLKEIADVVPFFKGVTRERLGKLGSTMASSRRWN